MTRLVIARLARGGETLCASRSSLAGLAQVASTGWSRFPMAARRTPFASHGAGSVASCTGAPASVARGRAATYLPASVTSVRSFLPNAVSDVSCIPSIPPATRHVSGLQRPHVQPSRDLLDGGTLGPEAQRLSSEFLTEQKGGGFRRQP